MSAVLDFKALASAALGRLNFANWANLTFGGRRNLTQILGYKETLDYWDYRDRYARGGVAKAVVDTYPEATWRGGVEVYEDEDPKVSTEFEKGFQNLVDKFGFWQLMQQADILAGLSTFSVILIGVSGDASLSEELPKNQTLLFLKPYAGGGGPGIRDRASAGRPSLQYGAFASIATYVIDPKDERFGQPKTYYIKNTTPGSSFLNYEVHWSRVIHVAEGCLEDDVFGIPRLECVYDLFDDLMKVTGGGAESFWLRASQGTHVDFDKDMGLPSAPGQPPSQALTPAQREEVKDKFQELRDQLQRVVVTRGATVTQLGSDVANFSGPADALLKQIAGASRIPQRILTGSEQGTLASEQDAANFDSRVQDRRTGYAGPKMVRRALDRLIEYGYLPKPVRYDVGWPVEENMDEKGKADYALSLANVNKTQGEIVITNAEIRDMAFNKKPLTDAERQPVAAPIRETDTLDANGDPVQPELKAALRALESAIESDDADAVARIIGMTQTEEQK